MMCIETEWDGTFSADDWNNHDESNPIAYTKSGGIEFIHWSYLSFTTAGLNAMAWNSSPGTGGPVGPNRIYVKPIPGQNYVGHWPSLEQVIGGGTNHYKPFQIGHISNANNGEKNPGVEIISLSYQIPF